MIKHGPGMVLCLKYVTNKVPSVAPLVVKLSHATTACSRQISKQCMKSPFLHECLVNSDISSSLNRPDTRTFVDPSTNYEVDRELKRDLEVTRDISPLIFDGEDCTNVQRKQSSPPCHCSASFLITPYNRASDGFRSDEICESSYLLQEKDRSVSLSLFQSGVEFQNSSHDKREEGLNPNKAQNDNPLDPFKPPTEEQLQKVLNTLADDLPRFFIKPFNYNIYHKNIIFEDNIRGKRFSGFDQYYLQAKLFYLISHLRFMYVNLDVLKITLHPEDGTVKVRWRISVIRIRKLFGWKILNLTSSFQNCKETWIDGFSTYYVMGDGLVHKHIADKMMPDREQMMKKENPTKTVPVPQPLAYSDRNKL